ncbi:hypothetical protein FBULB1_12746 [Fusarium bulbicola]|nr:hypothetical protein FBULB1_12746 [Fusarium bulbicola]
MVNQRLGPDDRRQMRAQDGVTQEHASADVEMINTEFDNTQPSLDCSWGRFQIPKVKHQDTTFGSGKEIEVPNSRCSCRNISNAMIAYIGNAQYTFESTLDRFEYQLDDHCLNCNQKEEKISDNSNELSFTARVKVARSLHQNKGQERMRETNVALASENAMLKEEVEKLTSTVADLMGRFAKLESTVHCKEAERKLGELEV